MKRQRLARPDRGAARLVLVAVLALATSFTACAERPAEPTNVLRVLMTDDWVTQPFLDAVRDFERERPEVRVDVDKAPISRMDETVRAKLTSGVPPDVVQGHAFSAAASDMAEPLDDLWRAQLKAEDFLPGALEDVTWADRRYGVPLDTNAMAIMYNVDLFEAAGVSPPDASMSFEDFEQLARAMTTADGTRRGIAVPTSSWWTYGWIRANGAEVVDLSDDAGVHLQLDSPPVVEAMAFLRELVEEGVAFAPRGIDSHSSDAYALFRSGRAAMHASGSWDLISIRRDLPEGNFGVVLMPQGQPGSGGTAMGGSSLFVPKGSTNRELGFEFMLQLTSDHYALRFAKEEGRLPARPGLFGDPLITDLDLGVFLEQLKTAHPPRLDAFDDLTDIFARATDQIVRRRQDPATILQEAQVRGQSVLDSS